MTTFLSWEKNTSQPFDEKTVGSALKPAVEIKVISHAERLMSGYTGDSPQ